MTLSCYTHGYLFATDIPRLGHDLNRPVLVQGGITKAMIGLFSKSLDEKVLAQAVRLLLIAKKHLYDKSNKS